MLWFMNRLINPWVRLVLKSPLHGMLSGSMLIFIYQGRKSGREYQLPAQYVQDGKLIYIVPGAPDKKTWWRNFSSSQPVRLVLQGQAAAGQAELLRGEAHQDDILQALALYLRHFPPSAAIYKVRTQPDGSFDAEDLRQAARSIIIVRVKID